MFETYWTSDVLWSNRSVKTRPTLCQWKAANHRYLHWQMV